MASTSLHQALGEPAFEAAAVNVEHFEDFDDILHVDRIVERPAQDVEILPARFEASDDPVDQDGVGELSVEQAEVVVVKLDPERLALEVFEPAVAKKPVPMFANPLPYAPLADIVPRALTQNPFKFESFDFALRENTLAVQGSRPRDLGRTTLAHREIPSRTSQTIASNLPEEHKNG